MLRAPSTTIFVPRVVFWDCDGVLANNSEALAMPVAGIILNEAMEKSVQRAIRAGRLPVDTAAPQFDIKNFTTKYAGGHFDQFYQIAADMLKDVHPGLTLPKPARLDFQKVTRTVSVLRAQAVPPAHMAQTLQRLEAAGLRQAVVSSSEFNNSKLGFHARTQCL